MTSGPSVLFSLTSCSQMGSVVGALQLTARSQNDYSTPFSISLSSDKVLAPRRGGVATSEPPQLARSIDENLDRGETTCDLP